LISITADYLQHKEAYSDSEVMCHWCNAIHLHFQRQGTIYSYIEVGLKLAVIGCLTNAIAPPPIVLESCSVAQADRPVF